MNRRRPKRTVPLAFTLAVFIFLINTLVLTSVGIYYARRFSQHIEQELVHRSALPGILLSGNRSNYKLVRNPAALQQMVGRIVDQALMVSPFGRIMYSSDPELEGVLLTHLSSQHPLFRQLTQTDVDVDVLRDVVRTPTSRSLAVPIYSAGELDGYLWLVVNTEADALLKKQTALFFFLGGFFAILLCGFSQFYLVQQLILPRVARMVRCVSLVEKGDLNVRISGSRAGDELGGLETSINRMVTELEGRSRMEKGLMEDIRRAKEDAEYASRCKSEFMANISHEIRTPMNGIIGLSELLLDSPLRDDQREQVDAILKSGEGLLSIVNNILALVRLENGTQQIATETFSLRGLMEDLHAYYLPAANGNGLEFDCTVDDDVPDPIISSEDTLRQILGNLLSNAFKFTQEGFVQVRVSLKECNQNAGVAGITFSVQDTGIGLSAEERSRVFDAFSQADGSHTRKYGGVGLGLTISRQMAEQLGGELEIESTPGNGAIFFFTARVSLVQPRQEITEPSEDPAAQQSESWTEAPAEEAMATASVAVEEPEDESSSPRVLVVEDNRVNRMMMVTALKRIGCEVTEAVNGLEALRVLGFADGGTGAVGFDLIMMDIQMPEMDGLEATRHIREQQTKGDAVPIVAVTAHAMDGDREIFIEAGMDDYLPKPVNSSKLIEMLEKYLEAEALKPSKAA